MYTLTSATSIIQNSYIHKKNCGSSWNEVVVLFEKQIRDFLFNSPSIYISSCQVNTMTESCLSYKLSTAYNDMAENIGPFHKNTHQD